MINFLYSSGISFYDIKPYYDNGDFISLRQLLHQKKDDLLSGKRTLEEEYQLLYINIFESKALFCLGKIDSASFGSLIASIGSARQDIPSDLTEFDINPTKTENEKKKVS